MKLFRLFLIGTLAISFILLFGGSVQHRSQLANAQGLVNGAGRLLGPHVGNPDRLAADLPSSPTQERFFMPLTPVTADDGASGDRFGISLALDGDTVLIGASGANIGGNRDQGAVYIFTRRNGAWQQMQKLIASDGAEDDGFGRYIALDGDTAVISAPLADADDQEDQGAVYVFTRSGETWTEQQKLVAPENGTITYFGRSVAVDGDTAVIGAETVTGDYYFIEGGAHVFRRVDTVWSWQQELITGVGSMWEPQGLSVALNGDLAAVGVSPYGYRGIGGPGKIMIFERSGESWTRQQELVASDGTGNDGFGNAIDLQADTAVVGADSTYAGGYYEVRGAAYLFTRDGAGWSERQKLSGEGKYDSFGCSVDRDGDTLIIGASDANAAYVFIRKGESWRRRQKLVAPDGAAWDWFGISVALDGDTAVVGASGTYTGGKTGQVYFYERRDAIQFFAPVVMGS